MAYRLGLSAIALAIALPAAAQEQPATEGTSSGGIEAVVVTATRRAESITKVPESISAFTTERMDQLNAKSFADLVAFTPGVTFDETTKNI